MKVYENCMFSKKKCETARTDCDVCCRAGQGWYCLRSEVAMFLATSAATGGSAVLLLSYHSEACNVKPLCPQSL